MDRQGAILLVDDEPAILRSLKRLFKQGAHEILMAESGEEGLERLAEAPIRVVISDYRMPGLNGVDFLKEVYARSPETVRIILSGHADRPVLVEAVRSGRIYKYIAKPWDDDQLKSTVAKGIEQFTPAWEKSHRLKELQTENSLLNGINDRLQEVVADRTAFVRRFSKALISSQEILDNLGPGIVCVGSDRVILLCNDAATAWLKTPRHGLIGEPMETAFSPELAAFVEKVLAAETSDSLYFTSNDLTIRGVRLKDNSQESSAVLFI